MARPAAVRDQCSAGPTEIAHPFLRQRRHPDRRQLAGAQQTRQATSIATIRLHLGARRDRDQRRRDHITARAEPAQQARQVIAGRAGLITGDHQTRIGEAVR